MMPEDEQNLSRLLAVKLGRNEQALDEEVLELLVTIGQGIYWSEAFHELAKILADTVNKEFELLQSYSSKE